MRESMTVRESDAMWLITDSGTKKHGYLLFDAHNIENPPQPTTASYYNMAFKFSRDDSKLIRMMMVAHGFSEVPSSSGIFNLCWGNYLFKDQEYRQLKPWQKLNHFPGSTELSQKDRLYRNVKQMKDDYQDKNFNFMPISFILPRDYKKFCDVHLEDPSIWIVKPIDSSQGRGIYVADQVNQVSPDDYQLVSKYIDSPLLLNGYKFDLRLYVVVTSLDPLVIYLYEDGLVRLAAEKYQEGQELWDPCIHLTNYCVNKFNSNYVKNEEAVKDNHGNEWSVSALLQHLKHQNVDTVTLMRNVEYAVTSTILAASANMKAASEKLLKHPNTCFVIHETQRKDEEFLEDKVKALQDTRNDQLLSKYQARLGVLKYLQGIQCKLMSGLDNEESVEMVSRFLMESGKILQKSFPYIIPYKCIPTKSRATILSRHLGAFMSIFKKETFMMMENDINTKTIQEVSNPVDSMKH